jgi:polar amino acid transport system substrate-binding protein
MRYAWIEEPPFNSASGPGADGVDVAVLRALADRIGEPLDFMRAEFADLLPGLSYGRWDVTAAMFLTPDREKKAFFTRPVWRLADGLLLRADLAVQVAGYGSIAEKGLRLGVLEGQVQHRTALACGVEPARIAVFADYASAAEAVVKGQLDAYASVLLAHRDTLARHPALAAVPVPETERPSSPGAFACATAKLRDRLDAELAGFLHTAEHLGIMRRFGLGASELP